MSDTHSHGDWVADTIEGLPTLATVPEAMAVLRCSRRHVYRLIGSGRLHAVRPAETGSSRCLIPRSSIEKYLRRLDEAAA